MVDMYMYRSTKFDVNMPYGFQENGLLTNGRKTYDGLPRRDSSFTVQ